MTLILMIMLIVIIPYVSLPEFDSVIKLQRNTEVIFRWFHNITLFKTLKRVALTLAVKRT